MGRGQPFLQRRHKNGQETGEAPGLAKRRGPAPRQPGQPRCCRVSKGRRWRGCGGRLGGPSGSCGRPRALKMGLSHGPPFQSSRPQLWPPGAHVKAQPSTSAILPGEPARVERGPGSCQGLSQAGLCHPRETGSPPGAALLCLPRKLAPAGMGALRTFLRRGARAAGPCRRSPRPLAPGSAWSPAGFPTPACPSPRRCPKRRGSGWMPRKACSGPRRALGAGSLPCTARAPTTLLRPSRPARLRPEHRGVSRSLRRPALRRALGADGARSAGPAEAPGSLNSLCCGNCPYVRTSD